MIGNELMGCLSVHTARVDNVTKDAQGVADDHFLEFIKGNGVLFFVRLDFPSKIDSFDISGNDLLHEVSVYVTLNVDIYKEVVWGRPRGSVST